MWYAIAYKNEADAQSAARTLNENEKGLIADVHPVALPFASEVAYPAFIFPEEFRNETLKTLSLSDGPTTATSEPQLRLILTEPVTVLLQAGDLSEAIEEVLRIYAPELGEIHVLATNPHGRAYPPLEEPGVLHMRFYCAPSTGKPPEKPHKFAQLFGRAVPAGMNDGLPPSGTGTPIQAPEGIVAEVHGNNLYVLFDLSHNCGGSNEELAGYLLAQILERFLEVRTGGREQKRDRSPEQGYVKACQRRRRLQLVHLKEQRTSLERRINETQRIIEQCQRELERVTQTLEGFCQADVEALARHEYRDLLKLPHVKRVEISGGYLHVHTDEIYLQHGGQTYPLGEYTLKIPMFGGGALAIVNKAPRRSGSSCYHHPHVAGGDGMSMCLGNWAPISRLIAEQQWSLVAQLMLEFLHHVNVEVGNYLKVLQGHWSPLPEPRPCSCQAYSVKAKGGMKP